MKVSIIGASGYTGRELIRLLMNHPLAELVSITSRSLAGSSLLSKMPNIGKNGEKLIFSNPSIEELCDQNEVNLFFLALPHGTAASYAIPLIKAGKKVIDLSADFRIRSAEIYKVFYGAEHPAPELLEISQYALPELNTLSWEKSPLLASPGCYPTSILIPLAPLIKENLVQPDEIVANSMSGVSGAGRNPSEKLLFCERNENACAYGLPKHRHLSEIEEQLGIFNSKPLTLSFHPHLIPVNRGICSTISARAVKSVRSSDILSCWKKHYGNSPFVRILENQSFPEINHVVRTNVIELGVHHDLRTNRFILCSAEDNLVKGAGGQAIQAMNICQGYPEEAGLT